MQFEVRHWWVVKVIDGEVVVKHGPYTTLEKAHKKLDFDFYYHQDWFIASSVEVFKEM